MKNPFEKLIHPEKFSEKINISKIIAAPKIYKKGVEKYKEMIKAGKPTKPIVVLKHPKEDIYAVLDGHHRFYAYSELGFQETEAAVIKSNKFLFDKTKDGWLQPTPRMTKFVHVPAIILARYINKFMKNSRNPIKAPKSVIAKLEAGIISLKKRKIAK